VAQRPLLRASDYELLLRSAFLNIVFHLPKASAEGLLTGLPRMAPRGDPNISALRNRPKSKLTLSLVSLRLPWAADSAFLAPQAINLGKQIVISC
jgi:hypothetical protein